MWHSMFALQIPIVEKILRTVLVYATILILFRLAGKRDLGTLNTLDFVVLFLLSNVVQNAIIGNDTSFWAGSSEQPPWLPSTRRSTGGEP